MDRQEFDMWYWVTADRKFWFPAMYDSGSAGGWTNGDTWEDFDREIIDWVLIPGPEDCDAKDRQV